MLHDELTQELTAENGHARLRLPLPLVERGDIELKKIGLEVVVRVAGPEAHYHPAPLAGGVRDQRSALRRRRAGGRLREGNRWIRGRRHRVTTARTPTGAGAGAAPRRRRGRPGSRRARSSSAPARPGSSTSPRPTGTPRTAGSRRAPAPRATPGAGPDLSGLLVLLDTLRQAAPAELQERTSVAHPRGAADAAGADRLVPGAHGPARAEARGRGHPHRINVQFRADFAQ